MHNKLIRWTDHPYCKIAKLRRIVTAAQSSNYFWQGEGGGRCCVDRENKRASLGGGDVFMTERVPQEIRRLLKRASSAVSTVAGKFLPDGLLSSSYLQREPSLGVGATQFSVLAVLATALFFR
jgi:hypothetical protein